MTLQATVGRRGEEIAAKYLESLGYEIRERNVRVGPKDEVDIIAFDVGDHVLVFAEVKTRSKADRDFRPELNAGNVKKEKLRRSARTWVAEHEYDGGYRIDLICVANGKVSEHVRELPWE